MHSLMLVSTEVVAACDGMENMGQRYKYQLLETVAKVIAIPNGEVIDTSATQLVPLPTTTVCLDVGSIHSYSYLKTDHSFCYIVLVY